MGANNGTATVEQVKSSVPATLTIGLFGGKATITTHAKPSKAENVWFEGKTVATLAEGADIREALMGMAAPTLNGETLGLGSKNRDDSGKRVLNQTSAAKYGRGHAKAGQDVPNTGGLPIISFVEFLPNMGERGYNLRVTFKGKKDQPTKVIVQVQAVPVPKPRESATVGDVSGDFTLG